MTAYRVAYFVSHPIQYQAPLLRYLAADDELDLKVFFFSDFSVSGYYDPGFGRRVEWDVPLLDGYEHEFLKPLRPGVRPGPHPHLSRGIGAKLRTGHFDAVWIHGYRAAGCLQALAAARRHDIPALVRGETHLRLPRTQWGGGLRERALPRLFRRAQGFLAIGTWNRDFYLAHGVSEDRVFLMPYAVDNEFFSTRSQASFEDDLDPKRPVILFASKLEPHKRPLDVLDAYRRIYASIEPRPYLVFIGDGSLRDVIAREAATLEKGDVRVLGFLNQTELPRYYARAQVFVLPSEVEPWGLVVNEVMNAGTAVVVSDQVGCSPDLVHEGVNGYTYPVGDVDALASRLREVLRDRATADRMGAASRDIVRSWDFAADKEGLLTALRAVVDR